MELSEGRIFEINSYLENARATASLHNSENPIFKARPAEMQIKHQHLANFHQLAEILIQTGDFVRKIERISKGKTSVTAVTTTSDKK